MVIQRWQSVMLLIACVMMACFTFLSLGQIQTADYTYNITTMGIISEGEPTGGAELVHISTWYLFCVSLMGTLIPLIAIFTFRNLNLQRRLCLVTILFSIASLALASMSGYTLVEGGITGWSSIIIAPVIAVVASIMAYRMIGSDRRKLRAVDRFHN